MRIIRFMVTLTELFWKRLFVPEDNFIVFLRFVLDLNFDTLR